MGFGKGLRCTCIFDCHCKEIGHMKHFLLPGLLAVVCGGIWVMRRKQRKLAPVPLMVAVGLLAALAIASVAGSFVWANGGVPPKFNQFNPNNNFNPNNGGFNPNFNPN